jgi:hypothetical protein
LMRMVWSLSEHILTGQQVMPVQQSAGCVCQLWSFSNSSSQLQLHLAQGLQRSVALYHAVHVSAILHTRRHVRAVRPHACKLQLPRSSLLSVRPR